MKLNWRQHGSLGLIALVFLVTLYQILPTLVYQSKPLDRPLNAQQVKQFYDYQVEKIGSRRQVQEHWLSNLCRNLNLSVSLKSLGDQPQLMKLDFKDAQSKNLFEKYLPTAIQLSSRALGDLWLIPTTHPTQALVATSCPWKSSDLLNLPCNYVSTLSQGDSKAYETPYAKALQTWAVEIEQALQIDPSMRGQFDCVNQLVQLPLEQWHEQLVADFARICTYDQGATTLGNKYQTRKLQFLFSGEKDPQASLKTLVSKLETFSEQVATSREGEASSELSKQLSATLSWLKQSSNTLQKEQPLFQAAQLRESIEKQDASGVIALPFVHPLISGLKIDPSAGASAKLLLHGDLATLMKQSSKQELIHRAQESLQAKLYELSAFLQQAGLGQGASGREGCSLVLDGEQHANWLLLDMDDLKRAESGYLQNLMALWAPRSESLQPSQMRIMSAQQYLDPATAPEDKLVCLILDPMGLISLPAEGSQEFPRVIFKGLELISQIAEKAGKSSAEALQSDLTLLDNLLQTRGYRFFGLRGVDSQWKGSGIFANVAPYQTLLKAMPQWHIIGASSGAFFAVENYEEWAKQINQIEDEEHVELVRWHEDWRLASSDMNPLRQMLAVKPPESLFSNNLKLSWRKLLRGDAKRVIKWGLDLKGGRTVRLAIYDANHQRVTDGDMLIQARNELVQRVNRIGLAEVAARIEGEHLVMDFPSSQGYSSKELIQATTMTFQLVNERFASPMSPLKSEVDEFLTHVWSEALVTHRQDIRSLNEIARRLLKDGAESASLTPELKLVQAGLKIASDDYMASSEFSEEYSMLVTTKEDPRMAHAARHPLLIVYRNWALQGSDLSEVRSGYDPQHGNILTFEVLSSGQNQTHPQEAFWKWTSHFSAEKINGTALESLTAGRGWRMAVLLNDQVISSPALSSGLKDRAMIHGQFSPRDVSRLAAELKAGSLTFTPQILSEENISPELGKMDRDQGLRASFLAIVAVIAAMVAYYRFGGIIASLAVIFNLLILWAVLQNLGAALTLPGLAAIVLTMGMAVDANVLVFERIREELSDKRTLLSAIQAGYAKAFSAIVDSNLTTILAALILVQFDSGPIKGFAMNLIIGIASSMFTALFMTRIIFEKWAVSRPKATLTMSNWIGKPKLPFLKWSKPFIIGCSLLTLIGFGMLWQARHSILGMDFVGGYAFSLSLEGHEKGNKEQMIAELEQLGLPRHTFDVRELGQAGRLKVYLSRSLDQPGSLFHPMKEESAKLEWMEQSLNSDLQLSSNQIDQLRSSWSSVSGQLSQSMRTQAIIGLLLALAGILAYLVIRFEWLYAAAGVICLSFDVLISLAAIGWLHFIGLPMQLDLQAIGAIMTIIGYALNDKIIVFDRIREERKAGAIRPALIQSALTNTLSRTLMTSGTTLLVLLMLDILGGASLFSFSMIMTVGVIFGTLSSLFVAPAVLLLLAQRQSKEN